MPSDFGLDCRRLISLPLSPRYPAQEPYDADAAEREAILSRTSLDPYGPQSQLPKASPEQEVAPQVFPVIESNPPTARPPSMAPSRASRGVSLYDPGPGKL